MTETIRYTLLGKEDIRLEPRTGAFEVTLADGRTVILHALDVAYLLSDHYPAVPQADPGLAGRLLRVDDSLYLDNGTDVLRLMILNAFARADLPTTREPGRLVRVTDSTRGLWLDTETRFFSLAGQILNVQEFGATGNLVDDDSAAINLALAEAGEGGGVYFPKTTAGYRVSGTLNVTTSQIVMYSHGATIRASTTADLFSLAAGVHDVTIRGLRLEGAAMTNATAQYAVITDAAGNARLTMEGCVLTGATSAMGFNNGIKFNAGSTDGRVHGNVIEQLVGIIPGTGYGVLCAGSRVSITDNVFLATADRGRHAVYLSSGASYCKVSGNTIDGFNSAGLQNNAANADAPNHHNELIGNTVRGGNSATTSGAINFSGRNNDCTVALNLIESPDHDGILLSGSSDVAGLNPTRNQIVGNAILFPKNCGIRVAGAQDTLISHNRIHGASAVATGNDSSIELVSDGISGVARTGILGNFVTPNGTARSAVRLNSTLPAPTETIIKDNLLAESGWFADVVEYNASPSSNRFESGVTHRRITPTYGTSVNLDLSLGDWFDLSITDGNAFTLVNPQNSQDGKIIYVTFRNNTLGAIGTITFDTKYKIAAGVQPSPSADGQITMTFSVDGGGFVHEIARTQATVGN